MSYETVREVAVSETMVNFARNVAQHTASAEAALDGLGQTVNGRQLMPLRTAEGQLTPIGRLVGAVRARIDSGGEQDYVDVAPGLSGGAVAVLVLAGLAAVGSVGYLVYTMTRDEGEAEESF